MLALHFLLFVPYVQATEVKVNNVDFNPEFVSRMIPKLEWSALVQAAEEVSLIPVTTPSVSLVFTLVFFVFNADN